MGGDDDHATVAVVTGHTVQRGLRSLDRIFLGIQHTVGNRCAATSLTNASPMPVQEIATESLLA